MLGGHCSPNHLLARSELAAQILRTVRARKLSQAKAGELLDISQLKISALLNGNLDGQIVPLKRTDKISRSAVRCGLRSWSMFVRPAPLVLTPAED